MGWLDDKKKELEGGIRQVGNNISNTANQVGQALNSDIGRAAQIGAGPIAWPTLAAGQMGLLERQPPPPPTAEDPRITALRNDLVRDADEFRSNLGKYKDEKYSLSSNAARGLLKGTTQKIKYNANSRGLLGSGLQRGAEVDAKAQMASSLAAQRAEINREAEELANAKDFAAAQVGLEGYQDAINRAKDLYDLALQRSIERRRALADIGEGVGYGLGSLAASRTGKKG